MTQSNIRIIEKPDWVSWEDIKKCLYEAHASNRANGVNTTHYLWPTDKIIAYLGENGRMFVALDGQKLTGVIAICDKVGKSWYANGEYAYLGFAGVLPEYQGRCIYVRMVRVCEEFAIRNGYSQFVFDTHLDNVKIQKIALRRGYRYVRFFRASSKDHYCVVMAKWINGCPYTNIYCGFKFYYSKVKTLLVTKILHK